MATGGARADFSIRARMNTAAVFRLPVRDAALVRVHVSGLPCEGGETSLELN